MCACDWNFECSKHRGERERELQILGVLPDPAEDWMEAEGRAQREPSLALSLFPGQQQL